MFFTLYLENQNGDSICMTETANKYMTSSITGLSPPMGTINTAVYAGMDGSYLNNAFIEKRNIVINFEMKDVGVEVRRHQLYKVEKSSRYVNVNSFQLGRFISRDDGSEHFGIIESIKTETSTAMEDATGSTALLSVGKCGVNVSFVLFSDGNITHDLCPPHQWRRSS